VAPNSITADNVAAPTDGIPTLAYDQASNRITPNGPTGWQYDNAGNMVRGQNASGTWLNFEYDAAGRLVKIMDDATPTHNVLETYTYGADRNRLINETSGGRTYYVWGGSSVIQEYTEATGTTAPVYSKSYIYAGSRLLSTATNISGSELVEYHHPDRLGTKVVTTPSATPTSYEQSTLPFGTELAGEESGIGSTNQKFTSYDRSSSIGLDYAVNRTYSSGQGRFTQVDPLGTGSSSIGNPQSTNLYAYVQNNPIDFVDPSGLNKRECDWEYHVPVTCVEGDCGFDWERAGMVLVCHDSDDGGYTPGTSDPGPGGGGSGPRRKSTPTPPTQKDPCAGKKGQLDFSPANPNWGMDNHIYPRHISTTTEPAKSKYTFWPWQRTSSQYKAQVRSLDQTTFEKGVVEKSGNNIVYSYAFFGIDLGNH